MCLKSSLMQRAFDLARLGAGHVSPNPMVGAVLVCQDRIIGEGYHAYYGGPHAEVMAVASVKLQDRPLIKQSTLYVSLEPCNITGRTPPCTDLILREAIPKVIVAGQDYTPGVYGSGLDRLRAAGVKVEVDYRAAAGAHLNRVRNVFVSTSRPYTMLKYAQSADGFLAPAQGQQWITGDYSRRLVHRWRAETDAILVGKRTSAIDNPALTLRYAKGKQPLRLVIDRHNTLSPALELFDGKHETWVFTQRPKADKENLKQISIDFEASDWLAELLAYLHTKKISHLTVEGGAWLLQECLRTNQWDEARVFTGKVRFKSGLKAPFVPLPPNRTLPSMEDKLDLYFRESVVEKT